MEPLTAVGIALSFFVAFVLFTAYSLKMAAKMGSEARSGPAVKTPRNSEKVDVFEDTDDTEESEGSDAVEDV